MHRLRLTEAQVRFKTYSVTTLHRHRRLILQLLEVEPFRGPAKLKCQRESDQLVAKELRLPVVFGSLCAFLRANRQEIPSYGQLADLINWSVSHFEANLQNTLRTNLLPKHRELLDNLLEQLPGEDGVIPANSPLVLTQLRDTDEQMSIRAIRQNVTQLHQLKELYHQCLPVLTALSLSDGLIETYALQVMRSRGWQVKQWKVRELYLLCFVHY